MPPAKASAWSGPTPRGGRRRAPTSLARLREAPDVDAREQRERRRAPAGSANQCRCGWPELLLDTHGIVAMRCPPVTGAAPALEPCSSTCSPRRCAGPAARPPPAARAALPRLPARAALPGAGARRALRPGGLGAGRLRRPRRRPRQGPQVPRRDPHRAGHGRSDRGQRARQALLAGDAGAGAAPPGPAARSALQPGGPDRLGASRRAPGWRWPTACAAPGPTEGRSAAAVPRV